MCDRHGGQAFFSLANRALNRRTFLKASALGTITMAVPGKGTKLSQEGFGVSEHSTL